MAGTFSRSTVLVFAVMCGLLLLSPPVMSAKPNLKVAEIASVSFRMDNVESSDVPKIPRARRIPNISIDGNEELPLAQTNVSENNERNLFTGSGESDEVESNIVVTPDLLRESFRKAEDGWLTRHRHIESLWLHNEGADSKSTIGTAYAHSAPNEQAIALSNTSILLELATIRLLKSLEQLESPQLGKRLKRQSIHYDYEKAPERMKVSYRRHSHEINTADVSQFVQNQTPQMCNLVEETLPCSASTPYRSFSGWCNNLKNPKWGKSLVPFDRMLPPAYNDGLSAPRANSVLGGPLPSPRQISQYIHVDATHLSHKHTLMFMQFGQFLDHDITHTPVNKGPSDNILNCRECDSPLRTHPECWPITIGTNDAYYPERNYSTGRPYCIPFTRSLAGQQRMGPREQVNQNSAYVDSSHIYGESICKAYALRAPGGKLNATYMGPQQGSLLPKIAHLRECKSPTGYCFLAGDPRASEQPALAATHTIFLRAHNRLVDQLHHINMHWDEDKLYNEGRRIISAIFQHITYNEFLPKLLGPKIISAYGLGLSGEGHYTGYNPECSATAFNEFATSAFRFGHSLIRPELPRANSHYHGMTPNIKLRDGFFNSDMLSKPLMVDEILRGLLAEPMEQMDPFVSNEIKNHLFEDKKRNHSGLDLIATNNHRGRDHGLPSYNRYRAVCNMPRLNTFDQLYTEVPEGSIRRLAKIYKHVDDIDLFTGSLVEKAVPGGLVGPTMACMIGTQFKRLRQCDRFWYETADPAIKFTDHQLSEIRKMTLAKILCDNMDYSSDIQKSAFEAPHRVLNPKIPCGHLPTLDVQAWRDTSLPPPPPPPLPAMPARFIQGPPVAPPVSFPQPLPLTSGTTCVVGGRELRDGDVGLLSPCISCVCNRERIKCASLKVTNCHKLFVESRPEDFYKDEVCMTQCGNQPWLYNNLLNRGNPTEPVPPPAPEPELTPEVIIRNPNFLRSVRVEHEKVVPI